MVCPNSKNTHFQMASLWFQSFSGRSQGPPGGLGVLAAHLLFNQIRSHFICFIFGIKFHLEKECHCYSKKQCFGYLSQLLFLNLVQTQIFFIPTIRTASQGGEKARGSSVCEGARQQCGPQKKQEDNQAAASPGGALTLSGHRILAKRISYRINRSRDIRAVPHALKPPSMDEGALSTTDTDHCAHLRKLWTWGC